MIWHWWTWVLLYLFCGLATLLLLAAAKPETLLRDVTSKDREDKDSEPKKEFSESLAATILLLWWPGWLYLIFLILISPIRAIVSVRLDKSSPNSEPPSGGTAGE